MKKTNLFFCIAYVATVSLIYIGCKKEKLTDEKGNPIISMNFTASNPTITDSSIIERQLRWIARGIPDMAQFDTAVQHRVEGLCQNPYFYSRNEDIKDELWNSLVINYQNSVYTNVNNRFPSNDFDSSLFYEFTYKDCKYLIGISIPELDIVDKNLPFVVVPTEQFNYQTDNYGYFIAGSGGSSHLDSVIT